MRLALLAPLLLPLSVSPLAPVPAAAIDLPLRGTFAVDAGDCRAAREETEGAYVVFDGASVGHGGQGGCDVSAIRKTGPDQWALAALCAGLEGPKTRRTLRLARRGKSTIDYDGHTYTRCPN